MIGNQVSNPANILVPENRINSTEVDWRESREEQDDEKPAEPERMFDTEPMEENFDFGEEKENSVDLEETSTDEECEKENLERKPFVVKEMVRLSQPKKKNGSSCKTLGEKDAADEINGTNMAKPCNGCTPLRHLKFSRCSHTFPVFISKSIALGC